MGGVSRLTDTQVGLAAARSAACQALVFRWCKFEGDECPSWRAIERARLERSTAFLRSPFVQRDPPFSYPLGPRSCDLVRPRQNFEAQVRITRPDWRAGDS